MLLQSLLVTLTTMGKWGWRRLTQLNTVQPSHVRNSAYAAQQLGTVEPCSVISSMLAWIHRYATLCNALFSMMWRIPQKCKQNFGGDLSTIATLMFAVLHVLLNSSSREYTEHPWKVYASILGVSCPPLLGWCSQCYSHITYTHDNTQYASFWNAPLSRMQSTSLRSVWYI